jgi:hypothetical protein
VRPAFLARLGDAGFDSGAQDVAIELGILREKLARRSPKPSMFMRLPYTGSQR